MLTQKNIAQALGITQSAVSLALRGDQSISIEMRQKVHDTAKQMGYHLNTHLSVLMSNIRTGRNSSNKGVLGLLVNAPSQKDWYKVETYRVFHQGMLRRGLELGFHIESFFLKEPGMRASRVDQIIQARGINGIILAPPCNSSFLLHLNLERYAAVGVGFGWGEQKLNLVGYDNLQNYITAFSELRRLGYKRIGTALDDRFVYGNRRGVKWYTGYLDCQNSIPKSARIPIFGTGRSPHGEKWPEAINGRLAAKFREWFLKWHPDAIISLVGREKKWLKSMNLDVPEDVGLACLAHPVSGHFAGIDENGDVVGAMAVELVSAQISHNEFGPPLHPKIMMVAGQWVPGSTVRKKTTSDGIRCMPRPTVPTAP